jgi:hypothetical protein
MPGVSTAARTSKPSFEANAGNRHGPHLLAADGLLVERGVEHLEDERKPPCLAERPLLLDARVDPVEARLALRIEQPEDIGQPVRRLDGRGLRCRK